MRLEEFIPIWQAQPFRAFRVHTQRGEFEVSYPMGAALTPQMRVAVVNGTRVEILALDAIVRCESFGPPMSVAEAMGTIPADVLAMNAQLISAALSPSELESPKQRASLDPGIVALFAGPSDNGVAVVHGTVHTREGQSMLSTEGTRWNIHGVEQFENGTSLYLHHLDHPSDEQRIILWPPDKGCFESFAEAKSISNLENELHRRDQALAAKPAKPLEPPAAYFRNIVSEWKIAETNGYEEAFGADPPAMDPARYEFVRVARKVKGTRGIGNPCLTDIMKEEIIFNLVDTEWDASGTQDGRNWDLSLRRVSSPEKETTLHIDVDRRAATIDHDKRLLSLGWIERHLRNFALYERWALMLDTLRAGPVKRKQPDVVVSLPGGFRAELWAGEPRYPLPFLQPHIVNAEGRAIFDMRATSWSATISCDAQRPLVTLIISPHYPLQLDLVTQRVTCARLKGSTTIGMIQRMVRDVHGAEWLREEIPKWFAKGRSLEESGQVMR